METIDNRYGIPGAVDSRIGGRSENQDSYGTAETRLGILVVVCDGMGGGPAGKTASRLACETIIRQVGEARISDDPERVLADAVVASNNVLLGAISAQPELQGMGTTCVCVLLNRKTAWIAHVGDSRCYQIRKDKVVFRTADHSYVAELVRRGTISEEDARNSKYSNVITRAIGTSPAVEPEIDKVSVKPGDKFALMSDGIWGMLPESHLVHELARNEETDVITAELCDRVDAMGHNDGGGHDNLTLALVEVSLVSPSKMEAAVDCVVEKPTAQPLPAATSEPAAQSPAPPPEPPRDGPAASRPASDAAQSGAARAARERRDVVPRTKLWTILAVVFGVLFLISLGVCVWLLTCDKDSGDIGSVATAVIVDTRSRTDGADDNARDALRRHGVDEYSVKNKDNAPAEKRKTPPTDGKDRQAEKTVKEDAGKAIKKGGNNSVRLEQLMGNISKNKEFEGSVPKSKKNKERNAEWDDRNEKTRAMLAEIIRLIREDAHRPEYAPRRAELERIADEIESVKKKSLLVDGNNGKPLDVVEGALNRNLRTYKRAIGLK